MPNLSEFGMQELEKRFGEFRAAIVDMQDKKDVMWKDMLWHFIHQADMAEIETYLQKRP